MEGKLRFHFIKSVRLNFTLILDTIQMRKNNMKRNLEIEQQNERSRILFAALIFIEFGDSKRFCHLHNVIKIILKMNNNSKYCQSYIYNNLVQRLDVNLSFRTM